MVLFLFTRNMCPVLVDNWTAGFLPSSKRRIKLKDIKGLYLVVIVKIIVAEEAEVRFVS